MVFLKLLILMAVFAVIDLGIEKASDNNKIMKNTEQYSKQRNSRIKWEFKGYCFSYCEEIALSHDQYGHFLLGDVELTSDVFREELEMEYSDDIRKYRDIKGNPVLYLYYSVPTFDVYDRQWDSYQSFYIIQYENHLTGIFLQGGYRLGKAVLYTDLRGEDRKTEELLKTMGMAKGKAV